MYNNMKWGLSLAFCILLTGCDKSNEHSYKEMKETAKYLAVFTDYVSNKCLTQIEFYDKEGHVLKSEAIKSIGDLSYQSYYDDAYYMYGPGGLLKINNESLSIEKIADGDINDIDVEDDKIYVYLNHGFTKNGKYDSEIKSLDGSYELTLDYHINDMEYHHGDLYTINTLESQYGKIFINVFRDDEKVDSIEVDDTGSFYIVNDEIYLLTQTYLFNIDTKTKIPLVDEKGSSIGIFSTFEAIHKYDDDYVLVNNEVSGSSFYYMDEVDGKMRLSTIDVSQIGRIKNSIYIENQGFFIINNNRELFKLTMDHRISNIQKINLDLDSRKSLFIGYERETTLK